MPAHHDCHWTDFGFLLLLLLEAMGHLTLAGQKNQLGDKSSLIGQSVSFGGKPERSWLY